MLLKLPPQAGESHITCQGAPSCSASPGADRKTSSDNIEHLTRQESSRTSTGGATHAVQKRYRTQKTKTHTRCVRGCYFKTSKSKPRTQVLIMIGILCNLISFCKAGRTRNLVDKYFNRIEMHVKVQFRSCMPRNTFVPRPGSSIHKIDTTKTDSAKTESAKIAKKYHFSSVFGSATSGVSDLWNDRDEGSPTRTAYRTSVLACIRGKFLKMQQNVIYYWRNKNKRAKSEEHDATGNVVITYGTTGSGKGHVEPHALDMFPVERNKFKSARVDDLVEPSKLYLDKTRDILKTDEWKTFIEGVEKLKKYGLELPDSEGRTHYDDLPIEAIINKLDELGGQALSKKFYENYTQARNLVNDKNDEILYSGENRLVETCSDEAKWLWNPDPVQVPTSRVQSYLKKGYKEIKLKDFECEPDYSVLQPPPFVTERDSVTVVYPIVDIPTIQKRTIDRFLDNILKVPNDKEKLKKLRSAPRFVQYGPALEENAKKAITNFMQYVENPHINEIVVYDNSKDANEEFVYTVFKLKKRTDNAQLTHPEHKGIYLEPHFFIARVIANEGLQAHLPWLNRALAVHELTQQLMQKEQEMRDYGGKLKKIMDDKLS